MKKNTSNSILTLLLALLVLLPTVLAGCSIESVDKHYETTAETLDSNAETVTVSISCDRVFAHEADLVDSLKKSNILPKDGVILAETKVAITDGMTVFDVLDKVTRENKIQMDFVGAEESAFGVAYIRALGNLYEGNCGAYSGWSFLVDGEMPEESCAKYVLHDGQKIKWVFICDWDSDMPFILPETNAEDIAA